MKEICLLKQLWILLVFLSISTPFPLLSQSYNTALGIRWGDGIGITARQRLMKKTSIEGIFYQHHKTDQTIAAVMLDHHMPVITRRLNLFAGGGVGRASHLSEDNVNIAYNAILVNAGLEFTIARLNLSWDIIPVMPLSNQENSLTTLTAFSLRYVLIKKSKTGLFQKDKKKRKHKHKRKSRRKK
jgi:hypothetical protein